MHNSFRFDINLGTFLFPGLKVTSTNGLIVTCVVIASLAVLYEGMKILQIKLRKLTTTSDKITDKYNSERSSLLSRLSKNRNSSVTPINFPNWSKWMLEIIHWSCHTTISYLLMLIVMNLNGYCTIAIIIGSGLGYLIFGPILMRLNMAQFSIHLLEKVYLAHFYHFRNAR